LKPFSAGFTLGGFSMQTCEADWTEKLGSDNSTRIYKLVKVVP
jgi:hypothetical protein